MFLIKDDQGTIYGFSTNRPGPGNRLPNGSPEVIEEVADDDPRYLALLTPTAAQTTKDQLVAIDRSTQAPRWVRDVAIAEGDIIDFLRATPASITTVADLVAYLRSLPSAGTGMAKLRQIEASADALRAQLAPK